MIFKLFAALFFLVATSAASAQSMQPLTFPRLGVYAIGSPHDYQTTSRQEQLARYDMVILNIWPGWESWRGTTMEGVVRNIKSRNANAKVFLYVANNEFDIGGNPASDVWGELYQKLMGNNWWLYRNGGGGSLVKSTWGDTHYIINTTPFSPRDGSGENFIEFFARYTTDRFLTPNPSVDGLFLDNVFWKPRVNGDWNRDGMMDDQNSSTVQAWLRQGARDQFDAYRRLSPGKMITGNIGDWGDETATFPELDKYLEGGLIEGLIGQSWSPESWGGWRLMMTAYRKALNATIGPKLTIFAADGSATDYRQFRYAYASCLLDDGVFHYNPSYSPPYVWFDEYDNKLGRALSGPQFSAWRQGIYRRDFERGIVLVNPKGNGAQTVDLDQEFRRIAGTQDPSVNNGQATRRVTLQDRDGLVLMRLAARSVPLPPAGVRVD